MPTRRLTSNLCVWYPKRLSRITSFHHMKDIIMRTKRGKRTDKRETFKLEGIKILVLDEFDKSLELGFQEEMDFIISHLKWFTNKVLTKNL